MDPYAQRIPSGRAVLIVRVRVAMGLDEVRERVESLVPNGFMLVPCPSRQALEKFDAVGKKTALRIPGALMLNPGAEIGARRGQVPAGHVGVTVFGGECPSGLVMLVPLPSQRVDGVNAESAKKLCGKLLRQFRGEVDI